MAKEQEYRQFIRERKLSGSFRSWRRLRSTPKRRIIVYQNHADGSSRRRQVYVLKERGRTVFRDFNTLQVLATTKRSIPKAIRALGMERHVKGKLSVRDWNVRKDIKKNELELRNVEDRYYLVNGIERRHRVTNRPPNKVGFVIIDATYISADGSHKRIQIRSASGDLGDREERNRLMLSAIENGSSLAGFSPIEIILHGVWYEWIRDRRI